MATIRPFNGLRFKGGDLNSLVCPPYDIISEKQREDFIEKNEHNIIRLELPFGEDKYREAGKLLKKWLDEGILGQDEKSGIYVYEMEFTADGKVMGNAGCNNYRSTYTLNDDTVTFGPVMSTKMACPGMQGEQLFTSLLTNPLHAKLDGDRLIFSQKGRVVLELKKAE